MNKLFTTLTVGGLLLGAASCNNQHEIIPAPVPSVELECSCTATIDGVDYEYTDTCTYDNIKNISTSGTSTAKYMANVENSQMSQGLQVQMQTLEWVDDGSNNPTTEEWKAFFENNMTPDYYVDSGTPLGVTVIWTDPNGMDWTSDTITACNSLDYAFTSMEHDSDQTGNYMKFKAVFNCPLRNIDGDTLCLENGVVKTSFKRE